MVELRALGGLRLRDSADDHEILSVLARAKPSGLLVYLALSPPNVSHGRDELCELLWPDSSTERARNSPSQALRVLRGGLGPDVIGTTEGDGLFLEAGAVWCDVAAFGKALASGYTREALELYGGHLWDGSDLSDCPVFERWLDREGQRLRLQAVEAAVTLAQELERDGSFVDASQWLGQARDWAPYDEAVVRPLLKLLHGLGDGTAAVREYDAYEERLAEVELTPSVEMSELIEKIRPSAARRKAERPKPAGSERTVPPMPEREDAAPASVTTQRRAPWRTRGRAAAAVVALGTIATAGVTLMSNRGGDVPALDPTRVLVDIFQNETGDPSLDAIGRLATDHVTAGLTYSTFVDVVSLGTQLLSREPVGAATSLSLQHEDVQTLARANGTGTVVWGSYYQQGDSLYFIAHVTNAATGADLATIESLRGPVDAPLAALQGLRDWVMTTPGYAHRSAACQVAAVRE
jgi:DNA-binding SARP family transcriptional activator